jgi:ABC-type phosphate transport system substrate-binding protein
VKRLTKALVALACLLGVSLLAPTAHAATDVPFTDDNRTVVTSAGSDTTYFLLNDLALAYNESEGCFQTSVAAPLTPTSPKQEQCLGATVPETVAAPSQANALKTENYDHDIVNNIFPQGSSAGRRQLCLQLGSPSGTRDPRVPGVQIARSSAGPAEGFQCTIAGATVNGTTIYAAGTRTLRFIAFAKDALTWAKWNTPTGASTAVATLTQAELNDIFVDCTITNWNQVGGGNATINVWTAISASGSRATWDAFVGGNSENCIPAALKDGNTANGERVIREHFAPPVEQAVNDPAAADEGNSIFFFSTGVWATNAGARSDSLLGNVNGITPSPANVISGAFPFSRLLYNVIIQTGPSPVASEATRRFTNARNYTPGAGGALGDPQQLGWICKPLSAHSKPIGDPGPGIESPFASVNYGELKRTILENNGFYALTTDPDANRCTFSDFRVDAAAQTPI